MKVGFTGTRHGITPVQMSAFGKIISELPKFTEFHHGDCIGADADAAEMIADMRQCSDDTWVIVCHPPSDETHRAFTKCNNHSRPAKTHFARNRDIVNETDVLIGCPGVSTWQDRGGTFYTLDYAIKQKKPVIVIWPDGQVEKR